MKVVNFHYVQQLQFIVCTNCRYCIAFKNFKDHFQRNFYHDYKNATLHAVLTIVSLLHSRNFKTIESSIDDFSIFYFSLQIAYQCRFIACKTTKNALNKHKRIVKKHLIKKHNIDFTKNKTSRTAKNIFVIKVQFFCIENQYRFFVVQKNCSQFNEIENLRAEFEFESSHAVKTTQNVIAKKLDAMYVISEQQWFFTFDCLQVFNDAHVDQISSWLRSTSINHWIIELQKNKKNLRAFLLAETIDIFSLIISTRLYSYTDRKTACR